jgi:hypothetical protein
MTKGSSVTGPQRMKTRGQLPQFSESSNLSEANPEFFSCRSAAPNSECVGHVFRYVGDALNVLSSFANTDHISSKGEYEDVSDASQIDATEDSERVAIFRFGKDNNEFGGGNHSLCLLCLIRSFRSQ